MDAVTNLTQPVSHLGCRQGLIAVDEELQSQMVDAPRQRRYWGMRLQSGKGTHLEGCVALGWKASVFEAVNYSIRVARTKEACETTLLLM